MEPFLNQIYQGWLKPVKHFLIMSISLMRQLMDLKIRPIRFWKILPSNKSLLQNLSQSLSNLLMLQSLNLLSISSLQKHQKLRILSIKKWKRMRRNKTKTSRVTTKKCLTYREMKKQKTSISLRKRRNNQSLQILVHLLLNLMRLKKPLRPKIYLLTSKEKLSKWKNK